MQEVLEASIQLGVEYLTLYAFSSENWSRPATEVSALMGLLNRFLENKAKELDRQNVRLIAIGQVDRLPEKTRILIERIEASTANHTTLTLVLALSYGGREEIVEAARSLASDAAAGNISASDIDAELFASRLQTSGIPDPDLLIRTSGEMRVSNFLLWQISYAEIVIVKKYWPDFRHGDLLDSVEEYKRRHRRFGSL